MTMSNTLLKQTRRGARAALDRLGLMGLVRELFFLVRHPRTYRILLQDYLASRPLFRRIARGAPGGDAWRQALIIASDTAAIIKLDAVLTLALRLAGFQPIILRRSSFPWTRRYHRLFGNRTFVSYQDYLASEPFPAPTEAMLAFKRGQPSVHDLLRLTYRRVDIGRIALSNVLYRYKFAKFDLKQPDMLDEVFEELRAVQRHVHAAERLLDAVEPALALTLEKGISPAAEIFGACIARGIPSIQYAGTQHANDFALKRVALRNRHDHPFSVDAATTWERVKAMPWSQADEEALLHTFAESYAEGTWFNRKFLHHNKRIKSAGEVRQQLGLDPAKKTAVIFSHVLWDATFFYGEGLFEDYETWFLEAVRAACQNPGVNWVVKLHPDLAWKLKLEGYSGELRDTIALRSEVGELPPHVRLVMPETDISTYSFFDITDYCLTVRGTIGIEMACFGVPVLTAGTGRYSNLGFTIDSSSVGEYLDRLAHLQDLPPMTPGQIELARRFAHTLFNLRPWPLRSFQMVDRSIEDVEHPLARNLVPRVKSFAEFAAAPDIRAFAAWAASDEVDYLNARL